MSATPTTSAPQRSATLDGGAFPVATLSAAIPELRRPFTTDAVKFKLQTASLAVPYIDARLAIERLNLVVPADWSDDYDDPRGDHLLCRLTVCGVTRCDVGKASWTEGTKGMYSDALKRAAVKFGIGVYLYGLPRFFARDGEVRIGGDGKAKGLKDHGERRIRAMYAQWLEATGVREFGEPLDHGDAPDSVGDYDADARPAASPAGSDPVAPPQAPDSPAPATDAPMGPDAQAALLAHLRESIAAGLQPARLDLELRALGVGLPDEPSDDVLLVATQALTTGQARILWRVATQEVAATAGTNGDDPSSAGDQHPVSA